MRITFNSQFNDAAAGLATTSEQLLDAQRQVTTGRRMSRISDDAAGAATAIAERAKLGTVEQYKRAADSMGSRLTVVDTVLSDLVEQLSAAQTAATGARGTTVDAAQRAAIAQQLTAIRAAVLDDLNTSFQGAYVFSGATASTRPFTVGAGGVVNPYAGSNTEVVVDIGEGRSVRMSLDGEAISQGSDTQDVFATFDDVIAAVNAGDNAAIGVGLEGLRRAFLRATAAQSRLGNDMRDIDAQKLRLQQMKVSGDERLTRLEAVDMAQAITAMTQADAAYRAALGGVGTTTSVSLLDYLR